MDFAQDGDLTRYDDADVADGALWDGDPEAFIVALQDAGFLDSDRRLHDWDDYAGRLIEQREQNRERMRKARARRATARAEHVQDTCGERAANVHRTCSERAGLPNLTQPQPNTTVPKEDVVVVVTPPQSEKPADDETKQRCLTFINQRLPTWPMAGEKYKDLLEYGDTLGWDLVREAVERTLAAGNTRLSYALGILRNWEIDGIRSMDDLHANEAIRRAAQAESTRKEASGNDQATRGRTRRPEPAGVNGSERSKWVDPSAYE